MFESFPKFFSNRRIAVDLFSVFFGIGAWIGVNGMFMQLPLLVRYAPEGWSLPSFMSIAVQIANLGPIFYAVCRKLFANRLNDAYWIYSLLILGILSPLLMSSFYRRETIVNGEPRSLILLILVFFTSIVGCTSSVLFFPYMRHYKEVYLISYLIGEGLSGFVPSILALIQGIGGNPECAENPSFANETMLVYKEPLFSSQIFFIVISVLMILSLIGFLCLNVLRVSKNERTSMKKKINIVVECKGDYCLEEVKEIDNHSVSTVSNDHHNSLSRLRSTNLLLLMSVISAFGNGIFPSIQSYSCLPYGNTAYHLAVTLSSMANPFACFLAVFLPHTSNRAISILTSICAIFLGYILATSVLSPTPPLVDNTWGIVIIVSKICFMHKIFYQLKSYSYHIIIFLC